MDYRLSVILLVLGLWVALLLAIEAGRMLGARQLGARSKESAGLGAVNGAVFGLLGLIIAFTFSGALTRFDERRKLIVEETNAIGTAYLRLDLLAPEAQALLRAGFRRYVDSRLEVYRLLPDVVVARAALVKSNELQHQIWRQAVDACRVVGPPAPMLLLPALNQMIETTTTRTMAAQMHPPTMVFVMLFGVALVGSLLVGYGMAGARGWAHILAFVTTMAITIWVICDLEYPRFGFIRIEAFDQAMVDLRKGME
jgi:hypothetical protein